MACKFYINGKTFSESEVKDYIGDNYIDSKDIQLTTLGDLADLLAYSNSKLILPGYEVEYTTPDDKKFKTYAEASNHISELAKNVQDVDLNNVNINIIENKDVVYFIKSYDNGTDADIVDYYVKLKDDYYVITPKAFNNAKDFLVLFLQPSLKNLLF